MRVILDTNLWSSIGDEMVARDFDDLMRSRSLQVLVPPSTLVEVIQLPVAAARQRIIVALAKGPRQRLRTEAESESAEVVSEIRRVRPHWMRKMPDTAKVASLNAFWTKRIWRAAVEDSGRLHDYQIRHNGKRNYLVANQKDQRAIFLRDNASLRPLTALVATSPPDMAESYLAGWSGSAVELWRIASRDIYWHVLHDPGPREPQAGGRSTTERLNKKPRRRDIRTDDRSKRVEKLPFRSRIPQGAHDGLREHGRVPHLVLRFVQNSVGWPRLTPHGPALTGQRTHPLGLVSYAIAQQCGSVTDRTAEQAFRKCRARSPAHNRNVDHDIHIAPPKSADVVGGRRYRPNSDRHTPRYSRTARAGVRGPAEK